MEIFEKNPLHDFDKNYQYAKSLGTAQGIVSNLLSFHDLKLDGEMLSERQYDELHRLSEILNKL